MRRFALVLLLLGASPSVAHAGVEEWALSFAPVYATLSFADRSPSGAGLATELAYGITDSLWLRTAVAFSAHPADADMARMLPDGTMMVVGAFGGVRYAFDLLRTIPYLDFGLGVLHARGAGTPAATNLAYEAAIGFERLQSRNFSWGLVIAYHAFLSDYNRLPVYLYVGPRFSLRWE